MTFRAGDIVVSKDPVKRKFRIIAVQTIRRTGHQSLKLADLKSGDFLSDWMDAYWFKVVQRVGT